MTQSHRTTLDLPALLDAALTVAADPKAPREHRLIAASMGAAVVGSPLATERDLAMALATLRRCVDDPGVFGRLVPAIFACPMSRKQPDRIWPGLRQAAEGAVNLKEKQTLFVLLQTAWRRGFSDHLEEAWCEPAFAWALQMKQAPHWVALNLLALLDRTGPRDWASVLVAAWPELLHTLEVPDAWTLHALAPTVQGWSHLASRAGSEDETSTFAHFFDRSLAAALDTLAAAVGQSGSGRARVVLARWHATLSGIQPGSVQ